MRFVKRGYSALATVLSVMALFFVSTASVAFIYSPEVPEELLKK